MSLVEQGDNGSANAVQVMQVVVDDVPLMASPAGWSCNASWYSDNYTCHCECGIWDPDCDQDALIAPSIVDGDLIELLDVVQVTNLLNLLDGDSNANGVLDEDEVVALDRRLGQ